MSSVAPVSAGRGRMGDTLALAVLFALASAALYFITQATKFFLLDQMVPVSRQVAWMAPVAHLAIWLAAALPVALVGTRLSREAAIRVAVFVFAFLAVFSVLLPWTQIGRLPAAILSAGVGVAVGRLFSVRTDASLRFARTVNVVLLVGFTAATGVSTWWQRRNETRAVTELPAAGDPGSAPNVLLLILDTVRASAMSLYGNARPTTPQLDSIARGSVVFDHAYSVAPWTLPSHASMFTGEYGGVLSSDFKVPLDRRQRTLAEALSSCGYETAGFVANLHYTAWDSGLSRGFARYRDYHVSWRQVIKSSWLGQMRLSGLMMTADSPGNLLRAVRDMGLVVVQKPAADEIPATELTDVVLKWHARRAERPFFAFVNYFDAHEPYRPPAAFAPAGSPATPFARYQGEIRYVDHEVGRLLRELDRRGTLANTIVIVTSDHGELFGEHGLRGHDNSVYREALRVPLIVRLPGGALGGQRVSATVSLRDIAATVSGAVGLPCAAGFPGASLARHWSDTAAPSSPAMAELRRGVEVNPPDVLQRSMIYALIDSSYYYVLNRRDQSEEVYAIGDTADTKNVARDEDGRLARLYQGRLREIVAADSGTARSRPLPVARR